MCSNLGGGGSGGGSEIPYEAYSRASESYTVDYQPYKRGQITRTDAGQLYKAVKNGDVTAKPELVKELYNGAESYIGTAIQRYNQDGRYYDHVYALTHSLLNSDFKTAQKLIDYIENDSIERAGQKSPWYKYKNR